MNQREKLGISVSNGRVYNILRDGFEIDREVADVYSRKISKCNNLERIKSILLDIFDEPQLSKVSNMIMDEL